MALDLARLRLIARGEPIAETGVTSVMALQRPSVTPQNPQCNASNVCNVSNSIRGQSSEIWRYDGRFSDRIATPGSAADAGQEVADKRNRAAMESGMSDRWCACGTMATVAVGHFKASRGNKEGVARWLCDEHFEAWRKSKGAGNDDKE